MNIDVMEPKKVKNQQQAINKPQTTSNPQVAKDLKNFVGDIKGEIGKITWTDKEELKGMIKIVVAATFLFGLSIFFVDFFIKTGLDTLSNIVRFFIG